MKRKTNLFYTTGPDSKFITFSNYTESLTGNFLSTDTKIFPSRFIALYIKGLNKNTKAALIKYLADYYESKLAALRDHFDYNKSDIEKSVPPLNYLLEALLRIKGINENEVVNGRATVILFLVCVPKRSNLSSCFEVSRKGRGNR